MFAILRQHDVTWRPPAVRAYPCPGGAASGRERANSRTFAGIRGVLGAGLDHVLNSAGSEPGGIG